MLYSGLTGFPAYSSIRFLLFYICLMYCLMEINECKLTSLTTVVNIAYRSPHDQTSLCWLTNSFLTNYG